MNIQHTLQDWKGPIAADTETQGRLWEDNKHLLGIALSSSQGSLYIPFWHYQEGAWTRLISTGELQWLKTWLPLQTLVGHNFTYDKSWIALEGVETHWIADTRLMWHMASAPAGPRPYGLKDAQKELLGWEKTNEEELETEVKAKGGKLRNGDHYLASLPTLAKYACLDTSSTLAIYHKLKGFFDYHDYWPLLSATMVYNELLETNSTLGVAVDLEGLQRAHKRLLARKNAALNRFLKAVKYQIVELEEDWRDRHVAKYKREYNRIHYLASPEKWTRFNLNSDAHKRELFYGKLRFPVLEKTDSGKPSTAADAIKLNTHPALEAYLKYEKANTLSTNFSGPYISSTINDRLHPGFNICGTVSYRLSGFKPYLLNAPFDERSILKHLKCDIGWVGVHADLSAIEPTITAHYSEDPSLLKVFRDGLGDIYLDLALELFPNDRELQDGYDPRIPITKAVKERFARQRKVSKVIQLAVQYTGTGHTVAKNLTKDGIPTSIETADGYVRAYWRKFSKVAAFNYRLREINRQNGHLRNVIGRIIRVPDPEYKDLSNRFIQSSAHDVLILWVLEIYRSVKEKGIELKPILIDCHDSTSNQCPKGREEEVKKIYLEALNKVVDELALSVKVKCEIKTFATLAGLKGEE